LVLFAHLLIVRALLPVLLTSLFILKTLALSILDALVLVLHAPESSGTVFHIAHICFCSPDTGRSTAASDTPASPAKL